MPKPLWSWLYLDIRSEVAPMAAPLNNVPPAPVAATITPNPAAFNARILAGTIDPK